MKHPIIVTLFIAASAAIYLLNQNINIVDNNQLHTDQSTVNTTSENTVTLSSKTIEKAKTIEPIKQSHTLDAINRIRDITEKTELQKHLVSENDQFHRYAEFNQRFENAKQDPTLMRHAIDERVSFSEDKEYALTVWADKKFYLKDQTINVNAILQNQKEHILTDPLNAVLINEKQNTLYSFKISAMGESGYMQASIDPSVLAGAETGIYKILITQDKYQLQDSVSFILSEPNIELTGEYRDYINDQGDLIIEAQVKTSNTSNSAQSFYVQASLYSSTQVAIGATQVSQSLTTGTHWLALSFDGLMISDTQESGPYELKHVSLARVTMPMQRAPLLEPDYSTQPYAYDEFR
jgi:hypothetical protein